MSAKATSLLFDSMDQVITAVMASFLLSRV
jgi:hypothetical protein